MTDSKASLIAYYSMLSVPAIFSFWAGRRHRGFERQRLIFFALLIGFNSDYYLGGPSTGPWLYFNNVFSLAFIVTLNLSLYLGVRVMISGEKPTRLAFLIQDISPATLASTIAFLFFAYEVMIERSGVRDTATAIVSHSHFDALYLLALTWTTVGYGDLVPVGHWGRTVAALAAVNGYFVFAVVVGTLLPRAFVRGRTASQ